ncbi:MAG: ATP-dependent Clp protease ATP-binding subunit ClpB [Chlamydiales bacterium]|jgi:ATP-dependent Clp protease ATP-binding subunit ClpB
MRRFISFITMSIFFTAVSSTIAAGENEKILQVSRHLSFKTFDQAFISTYDITTQIETLSTKGDSIKTTDGMHWSINWVNQWTCYDWKEGDSIRVIYKYRSFFLENLTRKGTVCATCKSIEAKESMTVSRISKLKYDKSVITLQNRMTFQIPINKKQFSEWQKNDFIVILHLSNKQNCRYAIWNLSLKKIFMSCSPHPEYRLDQLLGLESSLNEKVKGQSEAVSFISDALLRYYAGLHNPTTPIGKFLFLGPTGVGKTELAKQLAREVSPLGNSNPIRFNMTDFSEPHTISRLIGSPPGYVNHDEGGELSNSILENPYSIVLIDEFEKAHSKVQKLFLGILDEGYLIDSKGEYVDFSNTFLIFTSNISGPDIYHLSRQGLSSQEILYSIEQNVTSILSPELFNRLEPIIFHPLSEKNIEEIARVHLHAFGKNLKKQFGIILSYDKYFVTQTSQIGYSPKFGARPLRRHIESKIISSVSKKIIRENLLPGCLITLGYDNEGNVTLQAVDGK